MYFSSDDEHCSRCSSTRLICMSRLWIHAGTRHEAFRLQLLVLGLAEAGELVLARIAQGVRAVPTRCHQEPPDAIGLAEDDFIWTRKVVP